MRTLYCSRCKTTRNLLPKPYSYGGLNRKIGYYMCRFCNTERMKQYRKTPKGKIKTYQAARKSDFRNPEKLRARAAVRCALDKGRIIKPIFCSECGNLSKLDAHHEDYTQVLVVQWLCRSCHANLHRQLKAVH